MRLDVGLGRRRQDLGKDFWVKIRLWRPLPRGHSGGCALRRQGLGRGVATAVPGLPTPRGWLPHSVQSGRRGGPGHHLELEASGRGAPHARSGRPFPPAGERRGPRALTCRGLGALRGAGPVAGWFLSPGFPGAGGRSARRGCGHVRATGRGAAPRLCRGGRLQPRREATTTGPRPSQQTRPPRGAAGGARERPRPGPPSTWGPKPRLASPGVERPPVGGPSARPTPPLTLLPPPPRCHSLAGRPPCSPAVLAVDLPAKPLGKGLSGRGCSRQSWARQTSRASVTELAGMGPWAWV